jgi:hypothetical protein
MAGQHGVAISNEQVSSLKKPSTTQVDKIDAPFIGTNHAGSYQYN